MTGNDSADDQSEDGEIQQSPLDAKNEEMEQEQMDFSLSEDDGENIDDSLDIKPPQARVATVSRKRKDHEKGRKRSERYRDEREHHHREKHHREKSSSSRKEREHYQREKERYYRERHLEQMGYENQYHEKNYRERKEGSRSKRGESSRRHDEGKREAKDGKEPRHGRDLDKQHKREHFEDASRDRGDKALHDLRERLLSKRGSKVDEEGHPKQRQSRRERKHRGRGERNHNEDPLQGEAGLLVQEIINITTEEKHKHKRDNKEEEKSQEEKAEQEQRREKLLVAEREMARLKEQSRMERERRHMEKATKRKSTDDGFPSKRSRVDESVVMVSDASDDAEAVEDEPEEKSAERSRESGERSSRRSRSRSVSRSPISAADDASDHSSEHSRYSRSRSRSRSKSRSRSLTRSRSRSRSSTPGSDHSIVDEKKEESDTKKDEKKEEKTKLDESLPPYFPAVQGCRSVEEFQCLNRIEEGTYGVVYRARDKRTEDIVALKRLKMEKEKEGFPITSLREINTLLKGQHPNIVTVREIVVGSNMDKIFIVMDYVEHDLKSLMETMRHKKQTFMPGEIKCLLKQLLTAVAHLHDNWILHRDLKTSNLLLSHKGILKVGDFGLAREYGSPLKAYTPIVVTLWYRAPELLLCAKEYSTPIDIWSVGCIFAELLLMNALFPGKSEVDQLNRIFKDLGTPSEKIWPGFNQLPAVKKMKFNEYPVSNLRSKFTTLSEIGLGLLIKFLTFDPAQRVTAEEALKHAYFNEPPLPIDPAMFPTWPAKSELGHKRALAASPKPPSGGGEYKKLGGDGDDDSYGFRIGMGIDTRRGGPGFNLKF
nr:unnamed protein product [Callosobruchus analis]